MQRLIGFDGGYVGPDGDGFWWSADGTDWERTQLADAEALPVCPRNAPPLIYSYSGVSNGAGLLLMGGQLESDHCIDPLGDEQVPFHGAGWLTTDGRTTTAIQTPTTDFDWLYVWPTSAGWEALVTKPAMPPRPSDVQGATWQSADGIIWTETGTVALNLDLTDAKTAISAGGTRLLVSASHALASDDGIDWRVLDVPFLGGAPDIWDIAPPATGIASLPSTTSWLVAFSRENYSADFVYSPEIWRSTDLETWTQAELPDTGGTVNDLVLLSDGSYFVNSTPCKSDGDYCYSLAPRQFLSHDDGATWDELSASFSEDEFVVMANGPVGLLAVRLEDLTVWRLTFDN
ncbi:MAG: hypothetical protein QOJ81_428 [Chloroflexota bacterium]|nr:hypothetical protein [Chloroflexota bacterium]